MPLSSGQTKCSTYRGPDSWAEHTGSPPNFDPPQCVIKFCLEDFWRGGLVVSKIRVVLNNTKQWEGWAWAVCGCPLNAQERDACRQKYTLPGRRFSTALIVFLCQQTLFIWRPSRKRSLNLRFRGVRTVISVSWTWFCSDRAENTRNRKIWFFCFRALSRFFFQLQEKIFFWLEKKMSLEIFGIFQNQKNFNEKSQLLVLDYTCMARWPL